MKKILKLALILSLLMLSVSFAKSNSAASNNSKSQVAITFQVEGFDDIVWNIKNGHKVNQINDFHKKSGEFAKFDGIVDEWCVVEPEAQKACYSLQRLWSGPKFYTDAVIVGKVKTSFDITFVNYDGSKIVMVPTKKGELPVFPESEKGKLVREKTAKYSFSFKGWEPALVKATANATYKAVYDSTLNTFKVSFFVDGELFGDVQVVEYGKDAHFPKAKPAKEGFAFVGWDVAPFALKNVKKDLDVNAKFVKTYKVCYKGAEFDKCTEVIENSVVKVEKLPIDMKNTCTAWTLNGVIFPHKYVTVKKDLNFEGVCHANFVKVRFLVDGEQFGKTQVIPFGSFAVPPKKIPAKEGYRFIGWDKPFAHVFKDLDVNAKFVKTYKVCYEGAGLKKCIVKDSSAFVKVPPSVATEDSTCNGWTLNGAVVEGKAVKVEGDMNFQGVCSANTHEVLFLVDGVVVDSQSVAHGAAAVKPADPAKDGFAFTGWDADFSVVKSDLKINALFVETVEVCFNANEVAACTTVVKGDTIDVPELPGSEDPEGFTCTSWMLDGAAFEATSVKADSNITIEAVCRANTHEVLFLVDGAVVDSQGVAHGAAAVKPADPAKEGFIFTEWDSDFSVVESDLKINALFVEAAEVCFNTNEVVACTTVVKGDTVNVPELPASEDPEGFTCTSWTFNGAAFEATIVKADSNITIEAVCHDNANDVKFVAFDTVLVDSQRVNYGEAAVAPADSVIPEFPGYRFSEWDKDFSSVEDDMVVNAVFDTMYTVTLKAFKTNEENAFIDTTIVAVKDTVLFKGINKLLMQVMQFSCDEVTVNGTASDFEKLVTSPFVVTGKTDIVATDCHDATHKVYYFVESTVLGIEVVPHNSAALMNVKVPEIANKTFVGWTNSEDLKHVVSDLNVKAIYEGVDTVFVMVHGKAIDTIVVASGKTVDYTLKAVDDTADSTFNGWMVNKENVAAGVTIAVKGGMTIVADFGTPDAVQSTRVTAFAVRTAGSQLEVVGAKKGSELIVLDLQGRTVMSKKISNSVELVQIATSGTYLVRVGAISKMVTIR